MTNEKAHPAVISFSVVSTVVTGLLLFFYMWGCAADRHREIYHLPREKYQGFFGSYTEPAEVSFFDLDAPIILGLLIVLLVYPIIHVFIGRGVSAITQALCVQVSRVFNLTGEEYDLGKWNIEGKMIAGAVYPLTILLIPFLIIALVFGTLYRAVWDA